MPDETAIDQFISLIASSNHNVADIVPSFAQVGQKLEQAAERIRIEHGWDDTPDGRRKAIDEAWKVLKGEQFWVIS